MVSAWQGLGYNRRGLWLHRAAGQIVGQFGGVIPRDPAELVTLPGIGPNTAGSIAAFAYNLPVVFIETNIRRVFIHEFFPNVDHAPMGRVATVTRPISTTRNLRRDPEPSLVVSGVTGVRDDQLLPLIEASLDPDEPRQWY